MSEEGRRVKMTTRQLVGTLFISAVALVLLLATLGVFTSQPVPKGAVLSVLSTSKYGKVLVVGGKVGVGLGGFALYEFSGDVNGHLGCGTTKSKGYDTERPSPCRSPVPDQSATYSMTSVPMTGRPSPPRPRPSPDPAFAKASSVRFTVRVLATR